MFGPIRAVIVDDKPSHLFNISTGFSAAGIPCIPYWYDRKEVSLKNKLKPKPPEEGHEYLRVIFTDLDLDETGGTCAEAIGPAINVISQLVSLDAGPYAIVFWTAMKFPIEEIRAEVIPRLTATDVPLPIAIDEINKGPFLELPSDELTGEEVLEDLFSQTYGKVSVLKEEVVKILDKYGLLRMLSKWESRAICAAGKSSNNLYGVAKLGANGGEDVTASLRNISALVAKEATGLAAAVEHPAKAYDAAMQDILVDSFNQSVNVGDYSRYVNEELGTVLSKTITINRKENVYAELNTMFHIDTNVEKVRAVERGAVIELAEANKIGILLDINSFCCWDDFFWKPHKENVKTEIPKISDAMRGSLLTEINNFNRRAVEALSGAITSLREKRTAGVKTIYEKIVNGRQIFSESLSWVLLEVGADCDHAQGKSRSLRYLVAVEVPAKYIADYVYGGEKEQLRNDALQMLGPYVNDGELFYLLVSFKRFVAWQPPVELPEIVVQYRLRKVIVDFLLNNYAAWSMRPGIVEYKP